MDLFQKRNMTKKRVVCIGLVCVDLINVCEAFPREDTDQRVRSLHWQRGGNASNSSIVLSLLGTRVDFVGTMPVSNDSNNTSWGVSAAKHAINDLKKNGVGVDHVVYIPCEDFPTSMVMVNARNGSRTIMHSRGNLPELSVDHIISLDHNQFDWFHFESRPNANVISAAIKQIREKCNGITISLELEKVRTYRADPTLQFAKYVDLVFVSKDFATHMGFKTAVEAVEHIHKMLPNVRVICTWGSAGAAYLENERGCQVAAESSINVVDTLGAGDSFVGGVIHALCNGMTLGESVKFGCRVAEKKISGYGFSHVSSMATSNCA